MICPKCSHKKAKAKRCIFFERIRVSAFKQTVRGRILASWNNILLRCKRKGWLVPSVDRIDNEKGYSLENIQWLTWEQNFNKEIEIQRGGKEEQEYKPATEEEIPDYL